MSIPAKEHAKEENQTDIYNPVIHLLKIKIRLVNYSIL
jgi:hypothetical protein